MGTISQFFQPPLYWQQFEELATGLLGEVYGVQNAQQYGRPGQAQDGVDVFGRSRAGGYIGIQCKRLSDLDPKGNPYPGGPISRSFLRAAAKESLQFQPSLSLWILATTARRDTAIQRYVSEINDDWANSGLNRTALIWTWDECVSFLNSFPELQRWYYEDVVKVRSVTDLDEIILRMIATAFHRPAFEIPLNCETPGDFLAALKDTQQAMRTGELVDRVTRHVVLKAIGGWREIKNRQWSDKLAVIDKRLRSLRSKLVQGLRDETITGFEGRLDFKDYRLANELEDMRAECIVDLNRLLKKANIHPI